MPRKVEEWVGKTADTPVPDRVALRVFEKFGKACAGCGRDLRDQSWDCDHKIALINWIGEGHGNTESNLQPLGNKCCHPAKTKEDVKIKSQSYRKRAKAAGLRRSRRPVGDPRFKMKYRRETGRFEPWSKVTKDWVRKETA